MTDHDHTAAKQFSIFEGLDAMKKSREKTLAAGDTIRSAAEQSAAQDEELKLARSMAPPRAGPGRKKKQQPIDLTGRDSQPSSLAKKRKATTSDAAKAATNFQKRIYTAWTEDDRKVALDALVAIKGNRANTLK
jgi:hypothetical protein